MAKTVGRYSLEVQEKDERGYYREITVPFNIDGKEVTKLPLSDIDGYTTQFPTLKALNEALGYKGLDHIYVTYQFNGYKNYLDVALASKKGLTDLDMITPSIINISHPYYQMMMDKFINYLCDKKFLDRVLNKQRLSPTQRELIFEYGVNNNRTESIVYEIKKAFNGYKQFRDILFSIELQEALQESEIAYAQEREADEYEDDDYEPDKDAFISIAERAKYNDEDPDEYNEVGLRRFTK